MAMAGLKLTHPTLDSLLAGIALAPAIEVRDLTLDSRAARAGSVFFARRGSVGHGLEFALDAVRRGAAAVVFETTNEFIVPSETTVPWVEVPNLNTHLGKIAARFFGDPSRSLEIAAITGTNGKTTVAHLLTAAMTHLRRRCGYIGTLGSGVGAALSAQALTTPDVFEINRQLRYFVDEQAEFAALEASSHALRQDRLQGVAVDCAVFTNLSHDHLDYHASMADYAAAKALLFERENLETRVVNYDSDFGRSLIARFPGTVAVTRDPTVSIAGRSVVATDESLDRDGIRLTIASFAGDAEIRSALIGSFNAENLLMAFATLIAMRIGADAAAAALSAAEAPAGRMQRVGVATDPLVIVDFAHTPDALQAALGELRQQTAGTLWCVFGCGGDRDGDKRPRMGAVASAMADRVLITSDNPRSEDPEEIIATIASGCLAGTSVETIVDREEAIRSALERAAPDDVVLIAGKGHERSQEIAGVRIPFDDASVATSLLAERRA